MTWNDLKEFCNSLDKKQLKEEVIVWREGEAIAKLDPITLEEDHYYNEEFSDEGCVPESEMPKEHMPNAEKVYSKGDPIILEDFAS